FTPPRLEPIQPGFDRVLVALVAVDLEVPSPLIEAKRMHCRLGPFVITVRAIEHRDSQRIVTDFEHRSGHIHNITDDTLDGVASAVDLGRDRLDGNGLRDAGVRSVHVHPCNVSHADGDYKHSIDSMSPYASPR